VEYRVLRSLTKIAIGAQLPTAACYLAIRDDPVVGAGMMAVIVWTLQPKMAQTERRW